MAMRLSRALAPPTMATERAGTSNALASILTSAALASPSLGAARTRVLSTLRPSESDWMPSMESRPPLGVRRAASVTPLAVAVQGRGAIAKISDKEFREIRDHDVLDE